MRSIGYTLVFFALTAVSVKGIADERGCKSCAPTPISKPFVINESGVYCLTQDVKGNIAIRANDVVLDLNGYLIDGTVTSDGFSNIEVRNGFLSHVEGIAIAFKETSGFRIKNISVSNSSQALLLENCTNGDVEGLNAYGNINTAGAIVQVSLSESIQLREVDVCNNTKQLVAVPAGGNSDPAIGIIAIDQCDNIVLTDCRANKNTQVNDNASFAPLALLSSHNVELSGCEVCNNTIPENVVSTRGFAPIQVSACFNTVIGGCKVNNNRVALSESFLRAIWLTDADNTVITNSQVNKNSVTTFINEGDPLDCTGIFNGGSDLVVRGCQVCRNSVDQGGTGIITLSGISLNSAGSTVIEKCQVNENKMNSVDSMQAVAGIQVIQTEDVTIEECSMDGNQGGIAVYGVRVFGIPSSPSDLGPCRRVKIVNSSANANITDGLLAVGYYLGGGVAFSAKSFSADCDILNSEASGNSALGINGLGYGIAMQNTFSCTLSGNVTNRNGASGMFFGPVVGDIGNDPTPENSYDTILGCSSKINFFAGFEVSSLGTATDLLFEGNKALGNTVNGFLDQSAPFTGVYISNYAAVNGTNFPPPPGFSNNYFITVPEGPALPIQLYSLSITGTYTHISGTATLTSLTNIVSEVSL